MCVIVRFWKCSERERERDLTYTTPSSQEQKVPSYETKWTTSLHLKVYLASTSLLHPKLHNVEAEQALIEAWFRVISQTVVRDSDVTQTQPDLEAYVFLLESCSSLPLRKIAVSTQHLIRAVSQLLFVMSIEHSLDFFHSSPKK